MYASSVKRIPDGSYLGVIMPRTYVPALSNLLSGTHYHSTDNRIGTGASEPLFGQFKRLL